MQMQKKVKNDEFPENLIGGPSNSTKNPDPGIFKNRSRATQYRDFEIFCDKNHKISIFLVRDL